MTRQYPYSPLRTRNAIRLVDLSPGSEDDSAIHCNIKHTNLAAGEFTFEALSYTWGSEDVRETISCGADGSQLEVSPNCYQALRFLRHGDKVRTLWIDAICINQSDIEERNAQVRIMGDIFSAAEAVVVFLGESTPGSRALFKHLANTDVWIKSGRALSELPEPEEAIVYELNHLLKRPWFSRIWVVQELINSRDALFMCGNDSATYLALRTCLYGNCRSMLVIWSLPAPVEIDRLHTRKDLWESLTPFQEMYILVANTGLSRATDARDRILALTPLVKSKISSLERLVNYRLSIEHVFEQFAILLLSEAKLALLKMIRHPHFRSMPSWVPDWSQNIDRMICSLRSPLFFSATRGSSWYRHFRVHQIGVSAGVEAQPHRVLTVRGMRYGRIDKLGPLTTIDSEDILATKKAVKDLWATVESIRSGVVPYPPHWPDSIVQALQRLDEEYIGLLLSGGAPLQYESGGHVPIFDEEYISHFMISLDNKRIFNTLDGKLGLAPGEAQEGDVVCLIKGALEPCILRETDARKWNIISGDCFMVDIVMGHENCWRRKDPQFEYLRDIISEPLEEFFIW